MPPKVGLNQYSAANSAVIVVLSVWATVLVLVIFNASKLYSFALVLGTVLPICIYATGNPRLCLLVGLVFAAPLGLSINFNMVSHIGGAPSYSIDAMDIFLFPLLVFLLRDFITGSRRKIRFSYVSIWWVGLIVLGMYSIVQGPYREFTTFEMFRMIKCYVLFLVIINECVRERHFEYVVWALAASVMLNVLVGYIQFILKADLGLQALGEASPEAILGANYGVYLSHESAFRVGALMGHPNLFSAYLALLLPIFISLLYSRYSLIKKVLLSLVSLLGGIALVLTLSRAGWLAFGFAFICLMAFVFFHPYLRKEYLLQKGVMLVGAIIALVLASGAIIRRLTQSDEGALDFRYEWMDIAWRMIEAKPLLGFGLNSFAYHMPEYTQYSTGRLIDLFGEVWPVVHNIYLLVWSEQGTAGFLFFIALHINVIWIAIKNLRYRVSDKLFALNIGALCGFFAIMIDGLASFFIRVPASGRVFWIVVALIVAINYWNRHNAHLAVSSHDRAT